MTTPMGDLPDWQTLVTPQIVAATLFDQGGGVSATLRLSTSPFRVWGVWVAFRYSSNSVYAAGLGSAGVEIQDAAGNTLIAISGSVRVANQVVNGGLAIPIPGFTPQIAGVSYQVNLVTAATVANTDFRASGGIYFSVP